MTYFVLAIGLLAAIGGVLAMAVPARLTSMIGGMTFTSGMQYLSAFGRFAFGVVFYFAAYQTKFSLALQIFAMFIVLSGIVVLFMSPATAQGWIERTASMPPGALRAVAAILLAFGAFLIYAAL